MKKELSRRALRRKVKAKQELVALLVKNGVLCELKERADGNSANCILDYENLYKFFLAMCSGV